MCGTGLSREQLPSFAQSHVTDVRVAELGAFPEAIRPGERP
jgi:hypothetical protein